MSDKPLHVETAEALGWKDLAVVDGVWRGKEPAQGKDLIVPRYDSSWCSAGQLVTRYRLAVEPGQASEWVCAADEIVGLGRGKTPTEAICRVVVQLAKEGKLHG